MTKPNPRINASTEIEMSDGTVLLLTVTWGLLVKLRAKNKEFYKRFSGLITKGFVDDIISALGIVYCGYLCAYLEDNDNLEDALTEDEFTALAPNDIGEVLNAAQELVAPKAVAASRARSQSGQKA